MTTPWLAAGLGTSNCWSLVIGASLVLGVWDLELFLACAVIAQPCNNCTIIYIVKRCRVYKFHAFISSRYPTPCTVFIHRGSLGSVSTFARRLAMWLSTVRVVGNEP